MITINSISATRFTLNGIPYYKNYISKVAGDGRVTIFNCYDRTDVLVEPTVVAQFIVNGNDFETAAELQAELIGATYTRSGGGTAQDEVLEYASLEDFPTTGTNGVIYIAANTGLTYTWESGSYVPTAVPPVLNITGMGLNRYIPRWDTPTRLINSGMYQGADDCYYIPFAGRPSLNGNSVGSFQRGQTQIDVILGNPLADPPQPNGVYSDNSEGVVYDSKGDIIFRVGGSLTEAMRFYDGGKVKLSQTPSTGNHNDKILVRHNSGEIKQIDAGISTTFVDNDGHTITVTNGIITAKTP